MGSVKSRWERIGTAVVMTAAVGVAGSTVAYAVADRDQAGARADSGFTRHGSHHAGHAGHVHGQHGDGAGHLDAVTDGVELVSKLELTGELGRVSDVSALKGFAYLGAYDEPTCETGGVWVVDIRDPERPKRVGMIESHEDTYTAEGVHVVSLATPKFTGDLLAFSNETCVSGTTDNGVGGMTLYDVSDPLKPKKLVEGFGDFTNAGRAQTKANMIHSILVWQAGSKAYAVAIDDIDLTDIDIFDITDPRKPVLIKETGLPDWPEATVDGLGEVSFFHDVEVRRFGSRWIMVASYWDAGYVRLDVTDPANPVFLEDSRFAATDPQVPSAGQSEGNAHQGTWTKDGEYFVATDEDFAPFRTSDLAITTGPAAGSYPSQPIGGGGPVTLLDDKRLNGPTVYGGYGCPGSAPVPPRSQALPGPLPPGEEAVLVLQRGPAGDPTATEAACFPGVKAAAGLAAGYDAVVIAGRHLGSAAADDPPYCGSGGYPEPIVSFCVGHGALHALFGELPAQYGDYVAAQEPAIGDVGERVDVTAIFDGWGYVHLFDGDDLRTDHDTWAVDESVDPAFATGFGDLSVHEVDADLDDPRLMHSAHYAAGYRALRVEDADGSPELVEDGAFIDEGGNNFWGVHPVRDTRPGETGTLVLLSDRDFGLYVVKHTG